MENHYDIKLGKQEESLYSIKITDNEMWIKNDLDESNSIFININTHLKYIKMILF